jgi:hypothetical protein
MLSRRDFIRQLGLAGLALLGLRALGAAPMVGTTDADAVALGYTADASQLDTAQSPKYVKGRVCSACALFQGNSGDASGGCVLFPGKQVAASGWCTAWTEEA